MSTPTSDRSRSRAWLAAAGASVFGLTAAAFACSQGGGGGTADPVASSTPTPTATPTPSATVAAGTVSCAVNGAVALATSCTGERVLVDGAPVLVIRHADGGFRRFDVLAGGALAEADGVLKATVLRTGTTLDVTIGSDRYRFDTSLLGNAP